MIPLALFATALLGATPAPPTTAVGPVSLALVVASNRSAQLGRPPLQYADDDGAKYHEVFAAVAGEDRTVLLTELDRDTARLFPALADKAQPPTRANVLDAGRRLAAAAAGARREGRPVRFYFVFAGHGDVDRGRGFLELADGVLTSDDLQRLLEGVAADEAHVILDSCNSFFVVNPRRPGGRRFATPRDLVAGLARRLPNVGVFLSTSAESEVFEWSELQSGVFSHAVRSGMLGAADVDHDRRVTYEELAAFVATAVAEIRNPLFRPQVFARGPGGAAGRTLVDLPPGAVVLTVDEPGAVRLAARDRDGLRWVDAHAEPGARLDLWLPRALGARLEIDRLATAPGAGVPRVEATFALPPDPPDDVALPALHPAAEVVAARGEGEVFRALFSRPFGPAALAAYRADQAGALEPVFGISREDADRMGLLLDGLAASERERRATHGLAKVTAGAVTAAFVGPSLRTYAPEDRAAVAAAGFTVAALALVSGTMDLLVPSAGESTADRFRAAMEAPGADQGRVVAAASAELHAMLQRQALRRNAELLVGGGLMLAGALIVQDGVTEAGRDVSRDQRSLNLAAGTLITCTGIGIVISSAFSDTPAEKIIALWAKDPGVRRAPWLSVAPLPRGGAVVGLSGTF